jgi:hypothetical protein
MPNAIELRESAEHVPAILCGRWADASRKWKSIAKRAARDGKWDAALATVEMIRIDDAPGEIPLSHAFGMPRGENVWTCAIVPGISKVAQEVAGDLYDPHTRELWYRVMRDLMLDGMDHFWFCLGVLGRDSAYFPARTSHDDPDDQRRVAHAMLGKLLRWWPAMCGVDERMGGYFHGIEPWTWRVVPLSLCYALGMSKDRNEELATMTPQQAEPHLRAFVASVPDQV